MSGDIEFGVHSHSSLGGDQASERTSTEKCASLAVDDFHAESGSSQSEEKVLRREESLNDYVRQRVDIRNFQIPGLVSDDPLKNVSTIDLDFVSATMDSSGKDFQGVQHRKCGSNLGLEPESTQSLSCKFSRKKSELGSFFGRLGLSRESSSSGIFKPKTPCPGDASDGSESTSSTGGVQENVNGRDESKLDVDTRGVRKTCGMNISVSFQFCLIIPMLLVIVLLALVISLPTFQGTSEVVSGMQATCSVGLDTTVSFTIVNFRNLTRTLTFDTLQTVSLSVRENSLDKAQTNVRAVFDGILTNRLVINQLSSSNAQSYYGQPSFVPENSPPTEDLSRYFNISSAPIMLLTIRADLESAAKYLYIGWDTNEFAGAFSWEMGNRSTLSKYSRSIEYNYARPSDATNPPGNVSRNFYETDVDSLQPNFNKPLAPAQEYNPVARPWYQDQAKLARNSSSLFGSWSDIYLFAGTPEVGLTFSYPLAFCGSYSCMHGVIAADLGTISMRESCTIALRRLIRDLLNESADMEEDGIDMSKSSLFIVQNSPRSEHIGSIIAASDDGTDAAITEIIKAVDSKNPIVSFAARLINAQIPFGDIPLWNKTSSVNGGIPFACFANPSLPPELTNCNEACKDQKCNDRDNVIVSAVRLSSASHPNFEVENGLELVVVISLPSDLFLGRFRDKLEEVLTNIDKNNTYASDKVDRILRNNIIYAVVVIVVGIALATLIAIAVTKPLIRLEKNMMQLRDLKFQRKGSKYHSRITEIRNMEETLGSVRNTLNVFGKFVPKTVVHNIVKNVKNARKLHVEKKEVTIVFSDIRNFTQISEALEEQELLYLLTKYLSIMTYVIEAYGGIVGEILGDGLLAFWNTPDDIVEHAALACASALAQQECMEQLNDEFSEILGKYNLRPLSIRIGIHTGEVLTGNIGSSEKMKFGCLGDPVNLASRLEGLCKLYGVSVLCSHDTFARFPIDSFVVRELDRVRVKGKKNPTKMYEIISLHKRLPNLNSYGVTPIRSLKSGISHPKGLKKKRASGSCCLPPGLGKRKSSEAHSEDVGKLSKQLSSRESSRSLGGSSYFGPMGPTLTDAQLEDIDIYERALHSFQAGFIAIAERALLTRKEQDTAGEILLGRIRAAREKYGDKLSIQDSSEWDGIFDLQEKSF